MALPRTDTLTAGAGQTVFPYTFWVPDDGTTNIGVWHRVDATGVVTKLVEGAGAGKFTVSNRGNQSGGNVTIGTAAAVNDTIVIESAIDMGTFTLFTQSGDFSAAALNDEFQRRSESMLDLERDGITRSPHLPAIADDTINMELEEPVLNQAIGWTSTTQIGNLVTIALTELQANKVVLKANGTAAAPALTWNTATDAGEDNGLFLKAANSVGLATGGVEAVSFDSSQNALFAGTIASGAITSTGAIAGTGITGTGVLTMGSGSETLTDAAGKIQLTALEQDGALVGEHIEWNGTRWVPATDTTGPVDGSGTAGTLAKWSDVDSLADSLISEATTIVTVAGSLILDSTLKIQKLGDALVDTPNYGQVWVEDTNNGPMFTDEGGSDRQLLRGTGGAVTDEATVVFNGTTGGIIKETAVKITVGGAVTGITTLVTTNAVTVGGDLIVNGGASESFIKAEASADDQRLNFVTDRTLGSAISFAFEDAAGNVSYSITDDGDCEIPVGDLDITLGNLEMPAGNVGLRVGSNVTNILRVIDSTDAALRCAQFQKNITTVTANAIVSIEQQHTSGGVPCLNLHQDDVSEGFMNFKGNARGVITGATSSLESVRVEINGTVRRLALYVDA